MLRVADPSLIALAFERAGGKCWRVKRRSDSPAAYLCAAAPSSEVAADIIIRWYAALDGTDVHVIGVSECHHDRRWVDVAAPVANSLGVFEWQWPSQFPVLP